MIDIVNEDREEFAPMTKKAVEVAATASKRERADDGLTYAIRLEFWRKSAAKEKAAGTFTIETPLWTCPYFYQIWGK